MVGGGRRGLGGGGCRQAIGCVVWEVTPTVVARLFPPQRDARRRASVAGRQLCRLALPTPPPAPPYLTLPIRPTGMAHGAAHRGAAVEPRPTVSSSSPPPAAPFPLDEPPASRFCLKRLPPAAGVACIVKRHCGGARLRVRPGGPVEVRHARPAGSLGNERIHIRVGHVPGATTIRTSRGGGGSGGGGEVGAAKGALRGGRRIPVEHRHPIVGAAPPLGPVVANVKTSRPRRRVLKVNKKDARLSRRRGRRRRCRRRRLAARRRGRGSGSSGRRLWRREGFLLSAADDGGRRRGGEARPPRPPPFSPPQQHIGGEQVIVAQHQRRWRVPVRQHHPHPRRGRINRVEAAGGSGNDGGHPPRGGRPPANAAPQAVADGGTTAAALAATATAVPLPPTPPNGRIDRMEGGERACQRHVHPRARQVIHRCRAGGGVPPLHPPIGCEGVERGRHPRRRQRRDHPVLRRPVQAGDGAKGADEHRGGRRRRRPPPAAATTIATVAIPAGTGDAPDVVGDAPHHGGGHRGGGRGGEGGRARRRRRRRRVVGNAIDGEEHRVDGGRVGRGGHRQGYRRDRGGRGLEAMGRGGSGGGGGGRGGGRGGGEVGERGRGGGGGGGGAQAGGRCPRGGHWRHWGRPPRQPPSGGSRAAARGEADTRNDPSVSAVSRPAVGAPLSRTPPPVGLRRVVPCPHCW
ncbi:hypothetical protein I4F81_009368 [Pyropia yezoensis]|uniref:Uncharacterized protein n=1 Tax=Pyropia yezoensis TaxID=2788 RepID=A0ACC3CAR3_PYRYE|nr:hypothetical protein I4F81_009368 [Neopyropia yezoensis]